MPFGLYQYNRLPQGISIGPDVAQEAMENLLHELNSLIALYAISMILLFSAIPGTTTSI